jgi:dephospho-CoA kinase
VTFCVGLTGGIASGKSTVTHYFEQLSVPVIDADQIARDLLSSVDSPCYQAVRLAFGSGVLNDDDTINRSWLREQIFNDKDKKQRLETILHPAIRKTLLEQASKITTPYCILSIPLLVEANLQPLVDRILVIDASLDQQLARLLQRDGMSEDLATQMITQQAEPHLRLSYADDILNNHGDKSQIEQQVKMLHKRYCSLATQ